MTEPKQCTCSECGHDLYSLHNLLASLEENLEAVRLHIDKMTDEELKQLGRPMIAAVFFESGYILTASPQWKGDEETANEIIRRAIPTVKKKVKKHVS
jgi:hypothetical protein